MSDGFGPPWFGPGYRPTRTSGGTLPIDPMPRQDLQLPPTIGEARAHEKGRREGLELAAARLADAAEQARKSHAEAFSLGFPSVALQRWHEAEALEREAATIRAMKDKP